MLIKESDHTKEYSLAIEEERTKSGIIDLVYSSVFSVLVLLPVYYFITKNIIVLSIAFLSLRIFYYFVSEYYFQRTLGKLSTSSIVVDYHNNSPSKSQILIRNVIRLFTGIASVFEDYPYAFHDKISKTRVIKRKGIKVIDFGKFTVFHFLSLSLSLFLFLKLYGVSKIIYFVIVFVILKLIIQVVLSYRKGFN